MCQVVDKKWGSRWGKYKNSVGFSENIKNWNIFPYHLDLVLNNVGFFFEVVLYWSGKVAMDASCELQKDICLALTWYGLTLRIWQGWMLWWSGFGGEEEGLNTPQ